MARSPGGRPRIDDQLIRKHLHSLPRRYREEHSDGLSAEWELRIGDQTFAVTVTGHRCVVTDGPGRSPQTVIEADPAVWAEIDEGTLSGSAAFLDRRLRVSGNLDLAVRLQTLFRPYRRARSGRDLDQVEISAGGLRLSCYLLGKGRPVVLLHGLGGSKITWLPVLDALAERYRVVVPDLPGHGESEKPRADYSARFYARVTRQLLDFLEIERAALVGNSMGGRIALEMALRSPGRVGPIALLAPSMPGLRWRYFMRFTRLFPAEVGAIPFPLRRSWVGTVVNRLFARPTDMGPEALAAAAGEALRIYRDPRARMAFFSSLRHVVTERPDRFWASLRRIKQPCLVVVGDSDRVVPPRLGLRLAERLPNAELLVIEQVGHVPQFEATGETLEALRGFLSSHDF